MMHATRSPRLSSVSSSSSPRTSFVLTVIEGPDADVSVTLDERSRPRAVVGSGTACNLQLTDPSVERCHAILAVRGGELSVCNMGAEGGVVVNGLAVKEAYLRGGELLHIGDTLLEVRRESGSENVLHRRLPQAFGAVLGRSTAMRQLFAACAALVEPLASILLEGEEGTGKELIAREIHRASPRASGPFVELSVTDTTEDMARLRIAESRDGVLFVDRINAAPPALQRLLAAAAVPSSGIRIIATTQHPRLGEHDDAGFDKRLAALLAAGRIVVPPLRDREGDVAYLAHAFWESHARDDEDDVEVPNDFLARFEGYSWPGNVRELEAAVLARRAMGPFVKSRQRKTGLENVDDYLDSLVAGGVAFSDARSRVMREFERRFVARALIRNGNVTRAARASGLALRRFQQMSARTRPSTVG